MRERATRHERYVRDIPGDPSRPFTAADVSEKFQRLTVPMIGEERSEQHFALGAAALQSEGASQNIVAALAGIIQRV